MVLSLMTLILMGSLLITGCAGGPTPTGGGPTEGPKENVQIAFMGWGHPNEKLVFDAMIKKYEDGRSMPSSQIVMRLAKTLQVRSEYFFRPQVRKLDKVDFRKRSSLSRKGEEAIRATIIDQIERRMEIEDVFPTPLMEAFQAVLPDKSPITSNQGVEALADRVRQVWNLGAEPIPDLADLFETKGVRVVFVDLDDPHFDGLAATVDGVPVVAVGKAWPGDRQRFTLAHELGHLLLRGHLTKVKEEQACHRFAGAFLFPATAVKAELGEKRQQLELRELEILKGEYRLSMQSILYRAKDLGIIDEAYFTTVLKVFSQRGWRRKEPGTPTPSETTRVFERLVWHALAEDFIGEQKAAELLGMSLVDFNRQRELMAQDADSCQ
jgi:Zn-dependent peptidase ImmA (M78 family)